MTEQSANKRQKVDRGFQVVCFAANPEGPAPKTRAKFTRDRRKEVSAVRKRGACLRCRVLKIPCSQNDPCDTCLALATKGAQSKMLYFSYCIRTHFRDVNIYNFKLGPEQHELLRKMAYLDDHATTLDLPVDWSSSSLVEMVAKWVASPSPPEMTLVGVLSSKQLSSIIDGEVGGTVAAKLRIFVHAVASAHIRLGDAFTGGRISIRELHMMAHDAGALIVSEMDRLLSSAHLSRAGKKAYECLFLLVFAAMLAIGYSRPIEDSPEFPRDADRSSSATLWDAMQDHLCTMLSHFLMFLGAKLGLPFDPAAQETMITSSAHRWKPHGRFSWKTEIMIRDGAPLDGSLEPEDRRLEGFGSVTPLGAHESETCQRALAHLCLIPDRKTVLEAAELGERIITSGCVVLPYDDVEAKPETWLSENTGFLWEGSKSRTMQCLDCKEMFFSRAYQIRDQDTGLLVGPIVRRIVVEDLAHAAPESFDKKGPTITLRVKGLVIPCPLLEEAELEKEKEKEKDPEKSPVLTS